MMPPVSSSVSRSSGRARGSALRPGRAAALTLLAAIAAPACRDAAPKPAVATEVSPSARVLRLISPGTEPLEPVRYALTVGTQQRISLTLHLSMRVDAKGSPIPPVTAPGLRLVLELSVVEATREGGGRCQLVVADADLADLDEAPPALVAEMRKGLPQLLGARGELTIQPDGAVRQVVLDVPNNLGNELGQFVAAVRLSLDGLAVQLPAEPIGLGASWDVAEAIEQSGLRVRQKTLYELAARSGGRVRLRFQISQTSERQRATLAGLPPGVTTDIVSFDSAGSGEVEIDLGRPAPVHEKVDVTTGVSFRLEQAGKSQAMSLSSESRLELDAL
jgi:hypothetical protein